ncbi:MAG: sugar phosphate isomerase/epimerase [Clostridiales bacterium]|nr:sugar phosphate isomerase/epimerase [Clostridiales bacterium]
MQIGAQFFTVRNQCTNLDDFALTLRKVADIGYKTVQISGTCPYEAQWLKEQLDKNGLQCVLTHIPVPRLTGETAQVIEDHRVFGCDNIGLGWYAFDESKEDANYAHFMATYPAIAREIREGGKYFMYHNHDQEFQRTADGRIVLEKLAEEIPAELMGFTLDTFWVQAGGGDPAQWLERLAGRVPVIHLKDFSYGRKMAVVGEGNINFDRVFQAAEASGTRYMLVEQDDCNGEDPIECLRRSYRYLVSCGFE